MLRVLHAYPNVQFELLREVTIALDDLCRRAPIPSHNYGPDGHPPPPCPDAAIGGTTENSTLTASVHLTLDCFNVMQTSPTLGEALVTAAYSPAIQESMQKAVMRWLAERTKFFIAVREGSESRSQEYWQADTWEQHANLPPLEVQQLAIMRDWHPASVQGLADACLPLRVTLLLLRAPRILQKRWVDRPSQCAAQSATPLCVLGTVHEVAYARREDNLPAPWLTLTLLPRGSGGGLVPSRLTVSLEALEPSEQLGIAVVGLVLEVHGQLIVSQAQEPAMAPALQEHLRAQEVYTVLSGTHLTQLLAPHRALAQSEASVEPIVPSADATTPLSETAENEAAQFAVCLWEGLRLAIGVEVAPPLCATGDLWCTDFFAASLDTVLGLLICLFSAQSIDEDGIKLLMFDEATSGGSSTLLSSVWERVSRAAPGAFVACPVCHIRSGKATLLPQYLCRAATHRKENPAERRRPHMMGAPTALKFPSAPGKYVETITGGLLSDAYRRLLVLSQVELASSDTLQTLHSVIAHDGGQPRRDTAAAHSRCSLPLPPYRQTHSVRRVGGQHVPYCATRAILATARHGDDFLRKPALFELMQRMDVVLRPALDAARRIEPLCAIGDAPLQTMLKRLSAEWLEVLGRALQFPTNESALSEVPLWTYMTPTLTPACGNLLHSYFLAAKALGGEVVDTCMMHTLVKVTCHHASMRTRCSAFHQQLFPSPSHSSPDTSGGRGSPPCTALVDALVAVGLCDATLHFLSGETVMGTCVLSALHAEAVGSPPADEREGDGGGYFRFFLHCASVGASGNRGPSLFSVAEFVQDMAQHLSAVIQR